MTELYGWARDEDMSYWLNEDGTKHRMFPNIALADDIENPYWIINKNNMTDLNVIEKHLSMLGDMPQARTIYEQMTNSIINDKL